MGYKQVLVGESKLIDQPVNTTDSSGTGNVPDPPKSTVSISEEGALLSQGMNATYSSGTGNVPDPPKNER